MEDTLESRRFALLEATYKGNKPPREAWEQLIKDFEAAGRVNGAANLKQRYERMK